MTTHSSHGMLSRTVLVTGGTDGIGYQTARALARRDAHVVIHSGRPRHGRRHLAVGRPQSMTPNTMPIFRCVWPLVRLAQRRGSPEKAGQRVAFLAGSPQVDEYTGGYFEGGPIPRRLSARQLDAQNQEQAWWLAADLVAGALTGRRLDQGLVQGPQPTPQEDRIE